MKTLHLQLSLLICAWHIFLNVSSESNKKRVVYTGYEAHRFFPNTQENLDILKGVVKQNPGVVILKQPGNIGSSVDMLVPAHLQFDFLSGLQERMPSMLVSDDLESAMDHESHVAGLEAIEDGQFSSTQYMDLDSLYAYYAFIQQNPSNFCKVNIEKYGESFEGRDLLAVVVSLPNSPANKPCIFMDGGTHAREWITVSTTAGILNDMVTNTQRWLTLLQVFNFIFVACVNPDGYVYSWDVDRFWRKSRATDQGSLSCVGVDPNRNYPFGHKGEGSSTNPCDETFAGTRPLSIPETKNLKEYAESKNCFGYFSMHSYSQMVLLCYGCQDEQNAAPYNDFAEHLRIANAATKDLQAIHGTKYTCGNSEGILYTACGTSADWFKGKYKGVGIPHAYTFELRDTGTFGFALPANQIRPCFEETSVSMLSFWESLRQDFLTRSNQK